MNQSYLSRPKSAISSQPSASPITTQIARQMRSVSRCCLVRSMRWSSRPSKCLRIRMSPLQVIRTSVNEDVTSVTESFAQPFPLATLAANHQLTPQGAFAVGPNGPRTLSGRVATVHLEVIRRGIHDPPRRHVQEVGLCVPAVSAICRSRLLQPVTPATHRRSRRLPQVDQVLSVAKPSRGKSCKQLHLDRIGGRTNGSCFI